MSSNTTNLALFKANPVTDGLSTFNIDTMLNDNWDKIDAGVLAKLLEAKGYTDTKIATLVNSSPATLDTLNELAAALGNDPNYATTMANLIGTKETPTGAQNKVDTHASDSTKHITGAERTTWNNKETPAGSQAKADAVQANLTLSLADYTKLIPYGGITTGTVNTYAIATPTISTLTAGMAISLKFNINNTVASTLNWNGKGAKGIKKANGTDVTNLKTTGIYTLRYDGTNFILQGEGGSGNAIASDLLSGKTASTDADDIVGTMANNASPGAVITLNGATRVVPAGYSPGGTITATITNLTAANVKNGAVVGGVTGNYDYELTNPILAADVLVSHVGFVNSAKVIGTMPNNTVPTTTLSTQGATKVVAAGYSPGGTITATITNLVAGNVADGATVGGILGTFSEEATVPIVAGDVVSGKKGYVNGVLVIGAMVDRGTVNLTPSTVNQAITSGKHSGTGVVYGDADLVAGNIKSGVNIFGVAGNVTLASLGGKKFASGTVVIPSVSPYNCTVRGLTFQPSLILVEDRNSSMSQSIVYHNLPNMDKTRHWNNASNNAGTDLNATWTIYTDGFEVSCNGPQTATWTAIE